MKSAEANLRTATVEYKVSDKSGCYKLYMERMFYGELTKL